MRILLSSICRGHVFCLASELAKRGNLERLYCAYPWFKMKREAIPRRYIANFPWIHTGFMAGNRYRLVPKAINDWLIRLDASTYGRFVAQNLANGDIFHGLSGHNLEAGRLAIRRGYKYVCDRGSSHISYQSQIMCEEGERVGISVPKIDPFIVDRELEEYSIANRIFLPSRFAVASFQAAGFEGKKLWCIPYGVDLKRWRRLPVVEDGRFRICFLGTLGIRKGVHDLISGFLAAALPNSELVLIGGHLPETSKILSPVKNDTRVIVTGNISQVEILNWFSRSSVFVLPSIEDGFGLVLREAQACGLPLIATCNTGGPDVISEGVDGYIVPIRSPEVIADRLTRLYLSPELLNSMKESALKRVENGNNWSSFADLMLELYHDLCRE